MKLEWCVMHRLDPQDPHRGPMTKGDALQWVAEWIEEGGKGDTFYVAFRSVSNWKEQP